MSKNKNRNREESKGSYLHPDIKPSILSIIFLGAAIVLVLSGVNAAGPIGRLIFLTLERFLGLGYLLVPGVLTLLSVTYLVGENGKLVGPSLLGGALFIVSGLGLIDVFNPGSGGIVGIVAGSLKILFGKIASSVLLLVAGTSGMVIALNTPLKIKKGVKEESKSKDLSRIGEALTKIISPPEAKETASGEKEKTDSPVKEKSTPEREFKAASVKLGQDYILPPLNLLKSSSEKPTVGDLRANANIIKRTLESFGVPVEMGEITIGPKVTRYTLKPAEGVKLTKITALSQDLSLALAAHPIRIEAPIPGKSLVGVEIPNKVGSIVRLGSLLNFPELKSFGPLGFALGRDVSGEPIFGNISKMPHLLIAGATGSGKSIAIHSLIVSLLYKNSPETLKLILIDPKRVELSIYEGLPHLITSVIVDGKKTLAALRFAISEMENRYELLLKSGVRDIQSYNEKSSEKTMPYMVVVIDELADLMAAYGREIEGSIVRLAQMARATGIHLIVATQRPSVEVITGLIKANITSRIALQVASQVDSRTILDSSGAEKLLGGGDMLFVSAELSKPKRIQGAYVSDDEVNAVVSFIKSKNKPKEENGLEEKIEEMEDRDNFESLEDYMGDDDELYGEAVRVVREANKASASLLQRRLKVGYARAARLLDIMEAKGVVGKGVGAKPREVFLEDIPPDY